MMIPKPGYKTTEFLAVALVALGSLVAACANVLPARYAAWASSISVGLYALGRGLAKSSPVVVAPATQTPPAPPTT
jgi:type IV secretory pathway protease TraF